MLLIPKNRVVNVYKHWTFGVWGKKGKTPVLNSLSSGCKEVLATVVSKTYVLNETSGWVLNNKYTVKDTVNVCVVLSQYPELDMQVFARNIRLLLNTFEQIAGLKKSKVVSSATDRKEVTAVLIQAETGWLKTYQTISLLAYLISVANSITYRSKDLTKVYVKEKVSEKNPLIKSHQAHLLECLAYYATNFNTVFEKYNYPPQESHKGIVFLTNHLRTKKKLTRVYAGKQRSRSTEV